MGKNEDCIEQEFLNASENIKKSEKNFDNDTLLKLYGYYKQATIGDCNIECPSFWQLKEKAKWEAWEQHRGIKKFYAMKKYNNLVYELLKE